MGSLRIKLYNDKWLQPSNPPFLTNSNITNLPSSEFDLIIMIPDSIPRSTTTFPPPSPSPLPCICPPNLRDTIIASRDKLCFVLYTPADTFMCHWYLIHVCLDASAATNPGYADLGLYYCDFLAKDVNDVSRSDELSRWVTRLVPIQT